MNGGVKDNFVIAALSANTLLSSVNSWTQTVEPILRVLLTLIQIGIALATLLWVWRRIRSNKDPEGEI